MDKHISLSQALEGYTLAAEARHLSPCTLADYGNTFRRFQEFLHPDDPPIAEITADTIRQFLASRNGLSKKTLLNYHTGLSALWTWAVKGGYVPRHIVHDVDRPKPEKRAIVPYTEEDVRAMLDALNRSRTYSRPGKRECSHQLPTAVRNRAIILTLLDTGMRATELCELCICDMDRRNKRIKVFGKGDKERAVKVSATTASAIWRYLATRPEARANDFLFVTQNSRPFDRRDLARAISRIGCRAGVSDAHPHRFRHTFAINFLRNGGNVFALQEALGHESMEMVKIYLKLAEADMEEAHKKASPVANWRL